MTTKNPKDVILVNCQEVPETVCVETRFISQAAMKQKKTEQLLYYTNNASKDLTMEEHVVATKNIRPPLKPTTYTVNLQSKQAATVQLPQHTQTSATVMPLNNFNKNNNFATITPGQNLNSAAVLPFSNASQFQSFNLNTSTLQSNLLGNENLSNVKKIRRSDKMQQTDISSYATNDIAIQCQLEDELDDLDHEFPEMCEKSLESEENSVVEKDNFLKFVKENSTQHKNCKECLICGELCKSNRYLYGHMAIHMGPKVLCYKCGQNLEHENLITQHDCKNLCKIEKAFLQCPHYTCNVKAISKLELYDHINEHANNRMYKCSVCRKSFCTNQEFLRHLLIRATCYTGAKRSRYLVHGLESQKDRLCRVRVFTLHTFKKCTTLAKSFLSQRESKRGFCKICLCFFATKSVYNSHRFKCIRKFRGRLSRKRSK